MEIEIQKVESEIDSYIRIMVKEVDKYALVMNMRQPVTPEVMASGLRLLSSSIYKKIEEENK